MPPALRGVFAAPGRLFGRTFEAFRPHLGCISPAPGMYVWQHLGVGGVLAALGKRLAARAHRAAGTHCHATARRPHRTAPHAPPHTPPTPPAPPTGKYPPLTPPVAPAAPSAASQAAPAPRPQSERPGGAPPNDGSAHFSAACTVHRSLSGMPALLLLRACGIPHCVPASKVSRQERTERLPRQGEPHHGRRTRLPSGSGHLNDKFARKHGDRPCRVVWGPFFRTTYGNFGRTLRALLALPGGTFGAPWEHFWRTQGALLAHPGGTFGAPWEHLGGGVPGVCSTPHGAPKVPSGCAKSAFRVRQCAPGAPKWTPKSCQRATLVAFWAHQDMRESKTGASRSGFRFPPPMVGPARPQSAPLAAP